MPAPAADRQFRRLRAPKALAGLAALACLV